MQLLALRLPPYQLPAPRSPLHSLTLATSDMLLLAERLFLPKSPTLHAAGKAPESSNAAGWDYENAHLLLSTLDLETIAHN